MGGRSGVELGAKTYKGRPRGVNPRGTGGGALSYAEMEEVEAGLKFKSTSGLLVETTGVSLNVDSHDINVHEVVILEGVGEGNTYYYNLDSAEPLDD